MRPAVDGPWRTAWATHGALRLRVRFAGRYAPGGRVVLLVHGLGGSGRYWDLLLPTLLAAGGCLVVAPDLPGFGESDKPPDASYSPDFHAAALAAGLAAAVAAAGAPAGAPLALAGHSAGGVVAAVFAGSRVAEVAALALIATPFPDGTAQAWRDVTGNAANRLMLALYGTAHTGLSPVWPWLGPWLWPVLPAPRLPRATLRDCMRHTIPSYVGTAEACLRPDHTAALAAAGEAPALLIYGGRDTKAPPGRAAQYAALFRRSRTVVLPDAGHHVLVLPEAQRLVARCLAGTGGAADETAGRGPRMLDG